MNSKKFSQLKCKLKVNYMLNTVNIQIGLKMVKVLKLKYLICDSYVIVQNLPNPRINTI